MEPANEVYRILARHQRRHVGGLRRAAGQGVGAVDPHDFVHDQGHAAGIGADLDGILLSGTYTSGLATDVPALIDAALLIGKQASTSDGQYRGFLDDVMIFNRALSQQEVVGIP